MAKPLKVAVIGTNIGSTLHVRPLMAAGFEVAALVGRDPERTAERAAHFGIPLASTSVEQIIASDIDAIVIATPPATRHPIAMAAMAAGKHVLCEKPLAASADLAREMRDAATASGVVTMLQHQLRWRPENAMLRRMIAQGDLGELIQGAFTFDFPMTQRRQPLDVPGWWMKPETGGGWLRNYNAHGIDLVRYMIGEFAAVSGQLHADAARGMSADDSYAIGFVLKNGMQGTMSGTCRSWEVHTQMRVTGADGTAVIDMLSANAGSPLRLTDQAGRREIHPPEDLLVELRPGGLGEPQQPEILPTSGKGYKAAHADNQVSVEQTALCAAFMRRIQDRTYDNAAIATFDDGVAAMNVIEAVERSHRERRWIDLI